MLDAVLLLVRATNRAIRAMMVAGVGFRISGLLRIGTQAEYPPLERAQSTRSHETKVALEGLAIAVLLSAAPIEAHANDMIRRLPEDAQVEIERKGCAVASWHSGLESFAPGRALEESDLRTEPSALRRSVVEATSDRFEGVVPP
jgi:hypothetical protein